MRRIVHNARPSSMSYLLVCPFLILHISQADMWYVIRLKLDIENTLFVEKFFEFRRSILLHCSIYWHGCCVACVVYPECESWSRVIFTASPRWPPTLPWNSADQNIADQFTSLSAINMCRMNFTQTFNILYGQWCYLSPHMELIFTKQ